MLRSKRHSMWAGLALVAGVLAAVAIPERNGWAQDVPDAGRVEQAIQRTDQVLERATEVVSGSDNAQAHAALGVAVETQAQAKSAFGSGELHVALRLTLKARLNAERAVALARGAADAGQDRVQSALERTAQIIERVTEEVRASGSEAAAAQLKMAIALQARAENQFAEGNLRAALRLTLEARDHAFKAARLANHADRVEGRVEKVLDHTDALIDRARPVIEESGNARAEARFEAALRLQTQAKMQFAQGNEKAAVRLSMQARENVFAALRLADDRS